jgi:hypothetical protein
MHDNSPKKEISHVDCCSTPLEQLGAAQLSSAHPNLVKHVMSKQELSQAKLWQH